jgi:hypothetical protein
MTSVEEILTISKSNKSKITKYFYGGFYHLGKALEKFKKHELNTLLMHTIETPSELCGFLRTPFFKLEEVLNHPSYKRYTIKRKREEKDKYLHLKKT